MQYLVMDWKNRSYHDKERPTSFANAKNKVNATYFETIDMITAAIKERFFQPDFIKYGYLEKALVSPYNISGSQKNKLKVSWKNME